MATDAEEAWMLQLRQMVINRDLSGLKEAHRNGQNLAVRIEHDSGSTALTLAATYAQGEIVEFLLEEVPAVWEDEVFLACVVALRNLSRTYSYVHLDLLRCLMTCGKHIPYNVVLQCAFKILRSSPKELLVLLCEMALTLVPTVCRDISLSFVLYEETEVYWQLLLRGMSLNKLWPVSCGDDFYSKCYMADTVFDIYFNYGHLMNIHDSSRNKITRMTIQAANGHNSPAVLYVMQNFPADLYDDVFKYLVLAGFTMSSAAIQRISSVQNERTSQLMCWYRDFHSKPHSLKHLCRLCVRSNLRYNVVFSVGQVLLPEDLKRYLIIRYI